ncbi:hypothetical protein EVAR_93610_1 [Eumeta japonica]|uniref:Uncharacterized protein n=1 Tax=Eumeta variegata TaxID=151549 RepID=A0A4C1TQI5_EUMVA|nr:hypothetical protein EVAR_93610_1 [Eumeta japonica]
MRSAINILRLACADKTAFSGRKACNGDGLPAEFVHPSQLYSGYHLCTTINKPEYRNTVHHFSHTSQDSVLRGDSEENPKCRHTRQC